MIQIYKNRSKGGNGEVVVVTDAPDLDTFVQTLAQCVFTVIEDQKGDEQFAIEGLLRNSFQIAFKLSGYKAERVHEQKILQAGYSSPNDCDLIVEEK